MSTTDEASVDAETVIFDCKISAMEAVLQPLRKGSTHGASKVNIEYVKQTLLTLVERSDELVHLAHTVYVGKGTFNPRPGIEAATALLRRVTAIETIFINMGPVPGKSASDMF